MKTPLLHQTDLFRPHNDPDDHYDLACVYSLAYQNQIDLKGILIDYPPHHRAGDPDLVAVGQMNYITGLNMPVAVGTDQPLSSHILEKNNPGGFQLVIDVLRNTEQPVVITIVGSCRDIAIAGKKEPNLFAEKCAAIYLNAGTGSSQEIAEGELEYNVRLDPPAYSAIFQLPCPVYWMPCFGDYLTAQVQLKTQEFGTYFNFSQGELLPFLSPRMKNFFIAMLSKSNCPTWLRDLDSPVDEEKLSLYSLLYRNMWNTAAFIHVAGKTVTKEGEIVERTGDGSNAVFTFEPVEISCDETGITRWKIDQSATDRFIFHIVAVENYQSAMTRALKDLLVALP